MLTPEDVKKIILTEKPLFLRHYVISVANVDR